MKRFKMLAIFIAVAVVLSVAVSANTFKPGSGVIRGKVLEDGKPININDAIEICRYLAELPTLMDDSPYIVGGGDLCDECPKATPNLCNGDCFEAVSPTDYLGKSAHEYLGWPAALSNTNDIVGNGKVIIRIDLGNNGVVVDEDGNLSTVAKGGVNNGNMTIFGKEATAISASETPIPHPVRDYVRVRDTRNNVDEGVEDENRFVFAGRTLQIRRGGTYIIQGKMDDLMIYVTARSEIEPREEEVVNIIFNNVNITNPRGPAVYVRRAKECNIILWDTAANNVLNDSKNYTNYFVNDVTGGPSLTSTEPSAALFSNRPLNIIGRGPLKVTGNYSHAIQSRDTLTINGGKISATTTGTDERLRDENGELIRDEDNQTFGIDHRGNAIVGRDGLRITNGEFTLNATNHGLRSNNIMGVTIDPEDPNPNPKARPTPEQKFDFEYDSGFILIEGGKFDITTPNGYGIRSEFHYDPTVTAGGHRIIGSPNITIRDDQTTPNEEEEEEEEDS